MPALKRSVYADDRRVAASRNEHCRVVADPMRARAPSRQQLADQIELRAADIPSAQLAHSAGLEQLLRKHPLALEQFLAVQVVRPDGSVLASASQSAQDVPDPDFSHQAVFQTTLDTGAAGITEPVLSLQTRQPVVVATVPVRGPDGQTVAVLAGAVSLRSADLLPAAVSTLGDFSTVLVIYSQAGTILSHPDAQHRMQPVADEPGLGATLARRQAGGAVDLPHYLVATADVPAAGWTVALLAVASLIFRRRDFI